MNPTPPSPNLLGQLIKLLFLLNLARCSGCQKPLPSPPEDRAGWLIKAFLMVPIQSKCADCQTPEERAECEIRQATDARRFRIEGFRLVEDDPSSPEGNPDEPEPKAS